MTDSSLGNDRQRLPNHESEAQESPTTESPPAEIEAPPSETIAEIDQIWQRAGLSAAVRADGLIEVERHLALASEFESRNTKRDDRAVLFGLLVSITIFIVALTVYCVLNFMGWPQLLGLLGGVAAVLIVQFGLLVATSYLEKSIWFNLAIFLLPLFLFIGASWLLYLWIRASPDLSAEPPTFFLLAGVALSALFYFFSLGSMVFAAYLAPKVSRGLERDFAEAMYVLSLANALVMAGNEKNWRVAENRRRIAQEIEDAVFWIHVILRPRAREDSETVSWLLKRRENAVSNLRELKKWALAPRWGTREWFVDRLSRDLLASAYGSLDDVNRDETTALSQPRRLTRFLQKAWRVLRGLIAALIPLGIVLFLIWQNLISGAVVTTLLAVTIALPAVVLLRMLDPEVLNDVKRTQEFAGKLLQRGSDSK